MARLQTSLVEYSWKKTTLSNMYRRATVEDVVDGRHDRQSVQKPAQDDVRTARFPITDGSGNLLPSTSERKTRDNLVFRAG